MSMINEQDMRAMDPRLRQAEGPVCPNCRGYGYLHEDHPKCMKQTTCEACKGFGRIDLGRQTFTRG